MFNIGTPELLIIAAIIMFLFGGKKVQEWAKGIGETGRELKKAKHEFETSFNDDPEDKPSENNRKGVE